MTSVKDQLDIDNFLSHLKNGSVAKPSRYWVELFPPTGVSGTITSAVDSNSKNGTIQSLFSADGQKNLSLRCITAQMPGKSIQTSEYRQRNIPYKLPYTSTYDDVTVTFIASENLEERKLIEAWMGAILNVTDGTLNFYNEYRGDIKIHQLDYDGNQVYSVMLVDAFPIAVAPVDYSFGTQNELVNVSATFTYKYWKNITG